MPIRSAYFRPGECGAVGQNGNNSTNSNEGGKEVPNLQIRLTSNHKRNHKMIKKNSILKIRKHGEGNDPAKVAENATNLLTRYGHTAEELAELATADDAKLSVLFSARRSALEEDVITRRGKELKSEAELNGKKFAYKNSEDRIKSTFADAGFTFTDEELSPLEEKTRLEGMVKLAIDRIKTANPGGNTPEDLKALQQKLESSLSGQTAAQKAAKEWEKKYGELQASIPAIQEKMEMELFANQSWKAVALKKEVLENLTINDEGVLTNMVIGQMTRSGHKFAAEKQADGTLRLSVVDKDGNYVQMNGSVGNHTPESYVAAIYDPLVKKSNGGGGNSGGSPFQVKLSTEEMGKMDPAMRKAMDEMGKQAQTVQR